MPFRQSLLAYLDCHLPDCALNLLPYEEDGHVAAVVSLFMHQNSSSDEKTTVSKRAYDLARLSPEELTNRFDQGILTPPSVVSETVLIDEADEISQGPGDTSRRIDQSEASSEASPAASRQPQPSADFRAAEVPWKDTLLFEPTKVRGAVHPFVPSFRRRPDPLAVYGAHM